MKKSIIIFVVTVSLATGSLAWSQTKVEASELTNIVGDMIGDNEQDIGNILTNLENIIKNIEPSEAKKLFDFIEEQIDKGNWESKEGTAKAIEEGEKLFNFSLTETQREKLDKVIEKIKALNISPDFLLGQAKKVYEKYGGSLEEKESPVKEENIKEENFKEQTVKEEIRREVNNSIKDYFTTVVENVKNFIKGFLNIRDI